MYGLSHWKICPLLSQARTWALPNSALPMQRVLGAVSSGSCITRSPANSGKDTSLPLQALCASLAPGVLGPALRFTLPKLLREKRFYRTWCFMYPESFLSWTKPPNKLRQSSLRARLSKKVRPRHLVIPRAPSSPPIRSSPLFHITNRASNGCDVKHCYAQNSSTMFVNG